MKKIIIVLALFLSILTLSACEKKPTLHIYNWGNYLSQKVVKKFEKEFGVKVKQTPTFDTNETAITMLQSNHTFDLAVPSDYAVEQLLSLGLIEKIDWTKITVIDPAVDFDIHLKGLIDKIALETNYDLLDYGVPYFWGNFGIMYNEDIVSEADLTGWDIMKKADKYKISLYDSSRDSMLMALKNLGFSVNTEDESEIDAAINWLLEVKNKKVSFATDEILDDMPNGKYDLAALYSGDAAYIMSIIIEEKIDINLKYYVPNEGTNIWVDAMVIPKGANQELAYQFINFILREEISYQNSIEMGYASPLATSLSRVVNEVPALMKPMYELRVGPNDEIFRYSPKNKQLIDNAWLLVRTN